MHQARRLVAVGLSLCLSITIAGCGGSDDDETQPSGSAAPTSATTPPPPTSASTTPPSSPNTAAIPAIEVALAGGQVMGGPRKETVALGDEVRIRATSDVAEVLHVHTYNVKADLQPGIPGEVTFTAKIPGRHEVEFEKSGKDALTLEVRG